MPDKAWKKRERDVAGFFDGKKKDKETLFYIQIKWNNIQLQQLKYKI